MNELEYRIDDLIGRMIFEGEPTEDIIAALQTVRDKLMQDYYIEIGVDSYRIAALELELQTGGGS